VSKGEEAAVTLSCVVPAYENAPILARCLLSLVTQTGIDTEVIVADDSRTAAVRTLVEGLAAVYPQLRYVTGARTGNPVENWNLGLDEARGRYRVVVHHDEFYIDADGLRRAVDRLDSDKADVLVANLFAVIGGGRSAFFTVRKLARMMRWAPWTLYALNWVGPTGVVIYRGRQDLRFDPSLKWMVDVDFYVRLLTGRFIEDDDIRIVSICHEGQISNQVEKYKTLSQEMDWLRNTYPTRLKYWKYEILLAVNRLRTALRVAR
jgi:glycosyltransferase involved in cell wall biosynthesis